jgi:hypothetical protein
MLTVSMAFRGEIAAARAGEREMTIFLTGGFGFKFIIRF